MKVMWIGHGGLLFVSGKHKILIDPYLSDSLRSANKKLRRRPPFRKVCAHFFAFQFLKPSFVLQSYKIVRAHTVKLA